MPKGQIETTLINFIYTAKLEIVFYPFKGV